MDMLREIIKEEVDKSRPKWQQRNMTVMQRLMIADPEYGEAVKKVERFWLDNANDILCEVIDEIRKKITDPLTTMSDLVKALDVISDKYNLHKGKPTSIGLNYVKNLDDETLDRRIREMHSHFLPSPNEQYAIEGSIINVNSSEQGAERVSPPFPSPSFAIPATPINPLTDEHTAPFFSEEEMKGEKKDGSK